MSNFTMLQGQSVFKEVVTATDPYWDNGVYYEGDKVTTYQSLSDCFVEPMDAEESEYLPSGISLKDSRWLLCDHNLNTYRENNDDASLADTIYLSNPETGRKKVAYKVFDKEEWLEDDGMELLDSSSYNFILVKEGKL